MIERTAAAANQIEPSPKAAGEKSIATREETRFLAPPVDIYETADALAVVADLPGVGKDDVDIRVEDNILTIKGKTSYGGPPNAVHSEFGLLDFFRQFQLTDEVDQDKISAEIRNGVLTIRLPKAQKAKPRQVQVRAV